MGRLPGNQLGRNRNTPTKKLDTPDMNPLKSAKSKLNPKGSPRKSPQGPVGSVRGQPGKQDVKKELKAKNAKRPQGIRPISR